MNLTSRSRYALKIMLDLARYQQDLLVKRQDIVRRQGIPAKYLDQILVRLRRDGLVDSIRGRSGGYRIARDPSKINIWQIFRAVEDGIYPVECVDEHQGCQYQDGCVSNEPWQVIFQSMKFVLERMNLSEFEARFARENKMCPVAGIRECKPGREPLRENEAISLGRESSV